MILPQSSLARLSPENSVLTTFINHTVLFDVSAAGTTMTEIGKIKSEKFVSSALLLILPSSWR